MDQTRIRHLAEFDRHQDLIHLHHPEVGLEGFIAIHRGGKIHPAFGATRLWFYDSPQAALQDALKLSRMMSYKSALSGLHFGGAKAVLIGKAMDPRTRKKFLKTYADHLNDLHGRFITGTDMGLHQKDLRMMKNISPFLVGFRVDPTYYTGLGLFAAIQTCLKKIFGMPDITGRTFAIQGLGKIGKELLRRIYPFAKSIYASDRNETNIREVLSTFPKIKMVRPEEIFSVPVDVLAPCADGGCLNEKSISNLRCKIVAGGANNQLLNDAAGDRLYQSGILYAPDYVINAGGLISVAWEFERKKKSLRGLTKRVSGIADTFHHVLEQSDANSLPPHRIANKMAEQIIPTFQ